MAFITLIASVLVASRLTAGYLIAPSGTAFPGANSDCSEWVTYTTGLTCADIEATYSITEEDFLAWNPYLSLLYTDCNLVAGYDYCVDINFETFGTTSSSSTSSTSSTTSQASTSSVASTLITSTISASTTGSATVASAGITTPSPIQTGMTATCDEFYLVVSGDTCAAIASDAGIALSDFYAWNPAVGSSCADLDIGDYVCIGATGSAISSTAATATVTSSGTGIVTPAPIQTGMTATCDAFHLVISGDTCAAIASDAGIALSDFYAWNPAVGSSCADLDVGDYVCIGATGIVTSATATSSGTGIVTPAPIQTGMTATCDAFHLVVTGDTCSVIASDAGIALTDFYAWNPAVSSSCADLDVGDYVCVGIEGDTATATATTTTATTTGNGVTTPTPIQTGMVSDCDSFYYVVTGDGCSSIASAEGVTVAELEEWNPAIGTDCTDLWTETYICVGIL
ncbi:carbohydrate-binding module family 50 protein [Aspergillus aculeatus ATCC 16872]|uniref:Carbohydrate-binding module family 50 protein n=1 Tax=Aspergillus aculeatus (strain ATCC 16872 / CBS 172.66 / WB 5094) TaxID=690307 RepID=A0A1L9WHP7_ASPA1|nr:carbohydrate-binding module family 50 protein [Aspergillus aculeatus ATCC 16872]OJJ95699.1 carbohydrate-binding module family 50 protein [Aspergillus aculeatus ATCC 16872]